MQTLKENENMPTLKERATEMFDEKFGRSIIEDDDYTSSIGRGAGCDDCPTNIALRQEHKDFLDTIIALAVKEERERAIKICNDYIEKVGGCDDVKIVKASISK